MLHGAQHQLTLGVAGDDDHRQRGVALAEAGEEGGAVHAGHGEIEQDGMRLVFFDQPQPRFALGAPLDVEALLVQHTGEAQAKELVVIDDQQALAGRGGLSGLWRGLLLRPALQGAAAEAPAAPHFETGDLTAPRQAPHRLDVDAEQLGGLFGGQQAIFMHRSPSPGLGLLPRSTRSSFVSTFAE
jgi:hypothetical protein